MSTLREAAHALCIGAMEDRDTVIVDLVRWEAFTAALLAPPPGPAELLDLIKRVCRKQSDMTSATCGHFEAERVTAHRDERDRLIAAIIDLWPASEDDLK